MFRKFFSTFLFFALLLQNVVIAQAVASFTNTFFLINSNEVAVYAKPGENLEIISYTLVATEAANNIAWQIDMPASGFSYAGGADTSYNFMLEIEDIPLADFNPPTDNIAPLTNSGNADVDKYVSISDLFLNIDTDVATYQNTFSGHFFADGVVGANNSVTVFVDVNPHIVSANFNPSAIVNDGVDSTTLTVQVKDFNSCANLDTAVITADLSSLGMYSNAEVLTFDSCDNGTHMATFKKTGITAVTALTGAKTIGLVARDEDGNQNNINDAHFGSIDLNPSSLNLTVNSADAPTVSNLAVSNDYLGASETSNLSFTGSADVQEYKVVVGNYADCSDGVVVRDWTAGGAGNVSGISIDASQLGNEGANTVYVCVAKPETVRTYLGSSSISITKDTTPANLTFGSLGPVIINTEDVVFNWHADEIGTYKKSVNSGSEGSATVYNTVNSNAATVFTNGLFNEGENKVYIHFYDQVGNKRTISGTVTKIGPPPSMNGQVTNFYDSDTANDGIDGRDITVEWVKTNYLDFGFYNVFVLPSTVDSATFEANKNTYTVLGATNNIEHQSLTLNESIVKDSAGNPFVSGEYTAWVAVSSSAGELGEAGYYTANLILDDLTAPELSAAVALDRNTLRLNFTEAVSFVDSSKITATGLTIDTAYNLDGYVNGVKIDATDAKIVYVRVATLATDYTASDLALASCAVRDVNGTADLNESGNCADTSPTSNANASATNLTISEQIPIEMSLSSPATNGTDNDSIAVEYNLSELALASSVVLTFVQAGGNADAGSPHNITLSGESAGLNNEIIDGGALGLVDGAFYNVSLDAQDASGVSGTSVFNTNWTYDTTVPVPPVATQSFATPTNTLTPQFDWASVADAVEYRLELSLQATNYTPAFITQTIAAPSTTWTLDPPFASDGTNDDTYIWRVVAVDAAGNTSVVSNEFSFVVDTQVAAPTFSMQDLTSSSELYTNSTDVNIILSAYDSDVSHYLFSETQNTAPLAGAITTAIPGLAPQTIVYTFDNSTEEEKTVYVWLKDVLDNVQSVVASANILLDTTLPDQPSINLVDADNGADNGKTNQAEVLLNISNDNDAGSGIEAWCVASASSGAILTDPSITSCDTAQIGAETASSWLTVRPDTHILSGIGLKDVYVWTKDKAENLSPASPVDSIDYSTTQIVNPTLTIADQSSGSNLYSDSATIDLVIGNDDDAWLWCVKSVDINNSVSVPTEADCVVVGDDETASGWITEPSSHNLANEGDKTVYVWTKNTYGSVSSNLVFASIKYDATPPSIVSRKMQDIDHDGMIDAVQITMDEPISDASLNIADFALAGFSFTSGFNGILGSIDFDNDIATGASVNDEIFYLSVAEAGSPNTNATANLTYTAGTLSDMTGNLLPNNSALTTDNVPPVLLSAQAYDTGGATANGKVDELRLVFSESMNPTSSNTPWILTNVPSSGSLNAVSMLTTNVSNDTIILTVSEGVGLLNTATTDFEISLNNSSLNIADLQGNYAANFNNQAVEDAMAPVLVAVNYIATGNVLNDTLILSFSEAINDDDDGFGGDNILNSGGDLTIVGTGNLGASPVFATGSLDDAAFKITPQGAGAVAFDLSGDSVALKAGAVADLAGNASTSTVAQNVAGGVIINEIAWSGSATSTTDEWIELRNLSVDAIDFDTQHHCVYAGSTKLADLTGTISAEGYYLLSRYEPLNAFSALNIASDLSYQNSPSQFPNSWVSLSDTGLELSVYYSVDSTCDNSDILLDRADDKSGTPFAGNGGAQPASMERNLAVGLGTDASSWYTAVDSQNFDNTNQFGTPKAENVVDVTAPSFDLATQIPEDEILLPMNPGLIAIGYSDNVGGVGVDTAAVILKIDGVNCTIQTTSDTRVECDTSALNLAHGQHNVNVSVADLSGNVNTLDWSFWIDNFTFKVQNLEVDFADISAGLSAETSTVQPPWHTRITVTTYGAGLEVASSVDGALRAASDIPWHTNNVSLASDGEAFRIKEGVSGSFGNYFNFNEHSQIFSKPKLVGADLNGLKTYVYFVQYYVGVPAIQAAGLYEQLVNYNIAVNY